jgi:hypothetical protein
MTNARLLRNARLEYSTVNQNELYTFSLEHALSIYPLDAVYTFIPKNACSSLRYSIAIANGFLGDISDINWIHDNNKTFMSTQREVSRASYTFVVLRCPYTRVASCFLDKIVDGEPKFNDEMGNRLNLSFRDFLTAIKYQHRSERDEHWRNQSDFLHYERYDEYFSLESFSEAINSLGTRGFTVHDTRAALKHDLSNMKRVDGDFSKTKQEELQKMKEEGYLPSYKSMFGDVEIELANDIYNDDINLYKSHFGDNELLF